MSSKPLSVSSFKDRRKFSKICSEFVRSSKYTAYSKAKVLFNKHSKRLGKAESPPRGVLSR